MKKKNLCLVIIFTCFIIMSGCSKNSTNGDNSHSTFQEIWFPMEVGYQWKSVDFANGDTSIITIVGDTVIDGTEYYIRRYDYLPPEHGPHAWFWHVDSTQAFWLNITDTVLVYNYPFIEEEWNVISIGPSTNTFGDTIGIYHHGWITREGYSVSVPAGDFYDCWGLRIFVIVTDTTAGTVDTIFTEEEDMHFLARYTGLVKFYGRSLITFETGVDVDSLYILPPQHKSSGQFDLFGRYNR